MDKEQTLGLEKLGLEKPAAPRNASRVNQGKRASAEDSTDLQSELKHASGQHTSSISSSDPSAVPSYQPLSIAPIGSSAGYQPLQGFMSINALSTVSRVSAVPFVRPGFLGTGSESIVRKSTLSVVTYRGLPSSRVDKQYRYSKANLSLTEPVQHGRWTGSPPANLRKAASRPRRSFQSMKTIDLEATPPATRRPVPSIVNSMDELIHLPAPTPTSAYLSDAHATPNLLSSPQRLLLVLDLNGTLLCRSLASQNYTPRPCLSNFLEYAFANHSLLVWSSAQPYNVKGISELLFLLCFKIRVVRQKPAAEPSFYSWICLITQVSYL